MDSRISELRSYLQGEDLPIGKGQYTLGKKGEDVYLVKGGQRIHKLGVLDDSNRVLRESLETYLAPKDLPKTMTVKQLRRNLHLEKEALGAKAATLAKYEPAMRLLDPTDPLSEASIAGAISSTAPNTQHRRMVANYFKFACELHGVEWTPRLMRLSQKGQLISRKERPFFTDDQLEAQALTSLTRPWQKIHRLLMLYGLRPWEAFIAEPCQKYPVNVWIGEGKKVARGETKPRSVPPFHRQWFERYDMSELLQQPNPKTGMEWAHLKSTANQKINQHLRRNGLYGAEQSAYGYRHAYARRMHIQHNVVQAHGALFMGHSLATHIQTYQDWVEASSDPYAGLSD